ncbi:MAG: hypothetical protein ACOYJI_03255 [Anaerovoracaceae bacterium]|jgi:hypothetical protein
MGLFLNLLFVRMDLNDSEKTATLQELFDQYNSSLIKMGPGVQEEDWCCFRDSNFSFQMDILPKAVYDRLHVPAMGFSIFDSDVGTVFLYDEDGESVLIRGDREGYQINDRSRNLKGFVKYLHGASLEELKKKCPSRRSVFVEERMFPFLEMMHLYVPEEEKPKRSERHAKNPLADLQDKAEPYLAVLRQGPPAAFGVPVLFDDGATDFTVHTVRPWKEFCTENKDCLLVYISLTNKTNNRGFNVDLMNSFLLLADGEMCGIKAGLPPITEDHVFTDIREISLYPRRTILFAYPFMVPKDSSRFTFYYLRTRFKDDVTGTMIEFTRDDVTDEPYRNTLDLSFPYKLQTKNTLGSTLSLGCCKAVLDGYIIRDGILYVRETVSFGPDWQTGRYIPFAWDYYFSYQLYEDALCTRPLNLKVPAESGIGKEGQEAEAEEGYVYYADAPVPQGAGEVKISIPFQLSQLIEKPGSFTLFTRYHENSGTTQVETAFWTAEI